MSDSNEHRVILFSDLPAKSSNDSLEEVIRASIEKYCQVYGSPKRIWVNPKDVSEDIQSVDGYRIERRRGCMRGKVMIL